MIRCGLREILVDAFLEANFIEAPVAMRFKVSRPLFKFDFLLININKAVACIVSPIRTVVASADVPVEFGTIQRYAPGRFPTESGFMVAKTGNENEAVPAAQGKRNARTFELKLLSAAGLAMRMQ